MSQRPTTSDGVTAPPTLSGAVEFRQLGPYHIVKQLGEGGMGVVYLAEQYEPVRREVALKVLRAGAITQEFVARFESERQALALMDHPNITRVYDAGVTPAGLPYFVMERVFGVPITEYATTHKLSTEDRVRLIIQVCRAVQHAHQKGIIHRDIKPSNILVAEVDGEPLCKVIDFGIAKVVTPTKGDMRLTATGMIIGTPAYMSPEQFLSDGADIDTRSDIFSLGIVMYELLAGVLPFDPDLNSGWRALMANRASADFPAPSVQYGALEALRRKSLADERSTDPNALRRIISGDLDSIVLKSLENDRELRYTTVTDLASDLERYLRNEPVSAHHHSAGYRIRKFARRHRVGVTFGTAFAVLVLIAGINWVVQARRVAAARAIAVARQAQAEQLISFMVGDLRDRLEPLGKLDLLDEVGKRALAYFDAVPESELSDEELLRRSDAIYRFANVRLTQGRIPEAARLMQRSLALVRPLAARDSTNARWQLALAYAHYNLGQVEWQRGNTESALSQFEPFVRISNRLTKEYPDSLSFRAEVAYALNNIGQAREAMGDTRGALEKYRAAMTILDALAPRDTTKWKWIFTLAVVHNAAGVVERKLGDFDGALRDHQRELAIHETLVRRDTGNAEWHRSVAIARTYLSELRLARGDPTNAQADLDIAHGIYLMLSKRDTANVTWHNGLVNNEMRLGQLALERQDAPGALRHLDLASGYLAALLPKNAENVGVQRNQANIATARARAQLQIGNVAGASTTLASAIGASEQALAKRPKDFERRRLLADSYLAQGDVFVRQGAPDRAKAAWQHALTLIDSLARTTKQTDYLVTQAGALLRLEAKDAGPVVTELTRRGYRRPSFVALLRDTKLTTP